MQQKIQASMFWRSRRKEAGRRRRNRRRNTAENSYWFVCCFFFVPETSPLFFFSLVGHRLRLVRCFLLLGGGCCRGPRGEGGKHSQHTRPVLYIFERRICQPRATHPNSPTHFAVAPRTGGGLVFSVLLLFKNTDEKTHQYSTGGWEGWIRSFLQLTDVSSERQEINQ